MTVNPPVYEMTATTALEAERILEAARDLPGAHLAMAAPGMDYVNGERRSTIPVTLTIRLDLSALVDIANAGGINADHEALTSF